LKAFVLRDLKKLGRQVWICQKIEILFWNKHREWPLDIREVSCYASIIFWEFHILSFIISRPQNSRTFNRAKLFDSNLINEKSRGQVEEHKTAFFWKSGALAKIDYPSILSSERTTFNTPRSKIDLRNFQYSLSS